MLYDRMEAYFKDTVRQPPAPAILQPTQVENPRHFFRIADPFNKGSHTQKSRQSSQHNVVRWDSSALCRGKIADDVDYEQCQGTRLDELRLRTTN